MSDEQLEFQITDKLSFHRFLKISFSDAVPCCNTVCTFRELLNQTGEYRSKQRFELFLIKLNQDGSNTKEGKMMDATLVRAPIQCNSREENKEIKEGKTPETFTAKPSELAQKGVDARWTVKNNVSYFGYKNHVKAEIKRKFITGYVVTDAAVHDSIPTCRLLTEQDRGQDFYADSAYQAHQIREWSAALEMRQHIIDKGHRNNPLTNGQKQTNKKK